MARNSGLNPSRTHGHISSCPWPSPPASCLVDLAIPPHDALEWPPLLRRGRVDAEAGSSMSGVYPHFRASYTHEELVEYFLLTPADLERVGWGFSFSLKTRPGYRS